MRYTHLSQVKRFDREKQIQVYQELLELFAAEQGQNTCGEDREAGDDVADPEPAPLDLPASIPMVVKRRPALKVRRRSIVPLENLNHRTMLGWAQLFCVFDWLDLCSYEQEQVLRGCCCCRCCEALSGSTRCHT
jgi:hypothetical protein